MLLTSGHLSWTRGPLIFFLNWGTIYSSLQAFLQDHTWHTTNLSGNKPNFLPIPPKNTFILLQDPKEYLLALKPSHSGPLLSSIITIFSSFLHIFLFIYSLILYIPTSASLPFLPVPPTPFRTKSQSKKAVCNANSLKARPCSFLLKVECCPGASWTLRAPCSPLGNFLRAVFSQVEKHLSFRKFQQQLLAFSELLWSAAILQGDVPRRHVGLA